MSIAEPPNTIPGKGLNTGALGLVGNIVIGLSAVAPAYSLAATLGYVVLAVGDKAPSMFLIAFVPMLLTAFAYRELGRDTPDCGTSFTWGTKAFGPWVGWMAGWGLAVSAIIVLANVAEIAAIYLFEFLGLSDLAESTAAKVALGSFFIVAMTYVSFRGILISERMQNVLLVVQFGVLIGVSVTALVKVGTGTAGPQAITPQWSWLVPTGVTMSDAAQAIILCIFIYWGWDACLAVGEETKDSEKTPGRAAVITTLILVATYVLVGYAVQAFAGFGDTGIGLNNPDNVDDVLTILGDPVAGSIVASLLLLTVSISALSSTQTTILPTARGTLSMAVYEAIPRRFASVHPKYMTPGFGTLVMGAAALMFYLVLTFVSANALQDSVASLGLAVAFYYGITAYACTWYFRRTLFSSARNLFMRGIFPLLGGLSMTWAFVQSAVDMIKPDYGYTVYGPIGGVFVLGVGMLVLGIPLMLLCFVGNKDFFQGKTLTASTEVKVPDTY
ncbi:APC family permease [Rhodococcus fascians]|uniref:APC family permease n=1 Tax=Rhodococcoides fascians TaxID=1828 RepID=UPI0019607BA4|nr:APC family permease [Rhodococcus fascians]MBM7244971.1 APC family permease [Rhodococcus fascians]MBY3810904.1 APC family permease [Rhodococcus fascians]MBY3842183.1 APC family permease [Rhodococcus fascians]MBY3848021.1 APC family permease [Rhodococcus fascians]MBY3852598.1 APC family permease [Rhodococcus fascians]